MSSSRLVDEAEAIRRFIAEDEKAGSEALTEFARRHAKAAKYRNAALAIGASLPSADDPVVLEDLRGRMIVVLDGILGESSSDNVPAIAVLDARKRLFARYRRQPSEQRVVCRASDLEKRYPRFVLGPVSFEFRAGEITALVGENAHGKSTLIRTLIGELHRSAGEIEFPTLSLGKRLHWAEVRPNIGYLPQKLPDWRGSLADALYFQAALRGLKPAEADTQIQYVVARLGLGEFMQLRWSQLSGGTQLRFSLARALVGRPQMLVLDEPLANLDPKRQAKVLWDIRQMANSVYNPMTVLISSQVLNSLEAISDSVIFLHEGRVKYAGPRDEIGAERTYNVYECASLLSLSMLQERITKHALSVSHTGLFYIIKTPPEVSYTDMLRILQETNVPFTSLRDIGRSTIGLFELD
jgi:ABC-2 type transport system ATP-binding protein